MTTYPAGIKSFTTKTDHVDTVFAAHVNDMQAEITAIETELGTTPKGGSTDVKTRLGLYATTASSGKVLIGNGTSYGESTPTYPSASGTAGQVLIADGTNIIYSTPTYPNASATIGKLLRSDGTNFAASTLTFPDAITSGYVLYASDTSVISAGTPDTAGLVDKTTAQTVGGAKKFTDDISIDTTKVLKWDDASATTTTRVTLDTGYTIEMYWV